MELLKALRTGRPFRFRGKTEWIQNQFDPETVGVLELLNAGISVSEIDIPFWEVDYSGTPPVRILLENIEWHVDREGRFYFDGMENEMLALLLGKRTRVMITEIID